jgi:hypothetical protein
MAAALALGAAMETSGAYAADACYRDNAGRIITRRRPGSVEVPCPPPPKVESPAADAGDMPVQESAVLQGTTNVLRGGPEEVVEVVRVPPAYVSPIPRPGSADFVASMPIPDRWRIVDSLGYKERWWDPYNRNVLKADRPLHDDWFFNLGLTSDTTLEIRNVPTPSGASSTQDPGEVDVFGQNDQTVLSQTLVAEFVYYKGDTVFKPPEYEFRFTPVFNFNRTVLQELQGVNADPRQGRRRSDAHVGIQAAFVDKHLRDVSERYDFDSIRIGIQPFSSDFRGFLFQDNQLGVRLFGNRDNNQWQYNLAWFRRLEKDTNSGLNDIGAPLRQDDVLVANVYRQDFPVQGYTSQATVVYNRNRENGSTYYDGNDFQQRPAPLGRQAPRNYDVVYLGYNGDGHFGRINLTSSIYYALGKESHGTFVAEGTDISALFAATELSMDFDWVRARVSLLYGSADKDPFDRKATGFDAILENPQFAGSDTSYWIRQPVPLIGGGRVSLSGRNGVLNSLRSSKDEGQSNFTNPGVLLAGVGADLDVLPTLRVSLNGNTLFFGDTAVLEVARNQAGIPKHIGYDLSAALIWRPLLSQNMVVRASYSKLLAGKGFDALFPHSNPGYILLNAAFTY